MNASRHARRDQAYYAGGTAPRARFEDRLAGTALEMLHHLESIVAVDPQALPQAFERIEQARARGRWVALALDYELGLCLEPAFGANRRLTPERPLLSAQVYETAQSTNVWQAEGVPDDVGLDYRPIIEYSQYLRNIAHLRERIAAGDFYQVNYTFPLEVHYQGSPEQLYRRIASRHPVAHAAFFEDAHRTVLSFSPELFIRRQGGVISARPMKGTAPRDTDPARDRAQADALLASEKNRAENLMIVDLLRNDLGRIARLGTVKVDALFTLEQYPSVWTLTSSISAELEDMPLDRILRHLFPCGSVTGAPKIAAMKEIQSLEPQCRGIYCGSLGWLAPDGDFSLNVAIRTLELGPGGRREGKGIFGVGGGIVYDSVPEEEWRECLWKARILDHAGPLVARPDSRASDATNLEEAP